MFYWIYDHASWKVGALFAFAFIAATWGATFVLRRFLHPWFHRDRRANEMVGFVLSSYSVFYGILIGLVAVAAYQNFGSVSDLVTKEASSLSALYRDLTGYPQPIRADFKTICASTRCARSSATGLSSSGASFLRKGPIGYGNSPMSCSPSSPGRCATKSSTPRPCGS